MNHPSFLCNLLAVGQPIPEHRPWPRVIVTTELWQTLSAGLASRSWSLLGLWGEVGWVHMALWEPSPAAAETTGTHGTHGTLCIASLPCPEQRFPSVGRWHPPAQRLERSITDLVGLQPHDPPDHRRWLDHGRWPISSPLGAAHSPPTSNPPPYHFLPVEGASLHQIPVGPVHAGIIEPGHFRFTANGEAIVRLEQRLGYVHKGIERLVRGAPLEQAARIIGRISGDSSVAYSLALARAAEAATQTAIPERAHWLRAVLAELERIANHCGDIGAVCNDAAFALMQAHCSVLRERVLRTNATGFGQRLLMDCVVPGGMRVDLTAQGITAIQALLVEFRREFPRLVDLYDRTASLQQRTVDTGKVRPDLIDQFAAGGYVGRAGGRAFDARRDPGYPPYPQLEFGVPLLNDSDVNARVWLRIYEVAQSLGLIEQMLQRLPAGNIHVPLHATEQSAEGVALVEGFRGDILLWLRLDAAGHVAACHPRDPSWFQWPLLEAAIEGDIVADFPLCNKSFNCSYSGHDL